MSADPELIGVAYFEKTKVPKAPKWNEGKLQAAIIANARKVFKKDVGVVHSEFGLKDPMSLLAGDIDIFEVKTDRRGDIGRIDLILKYRRSYYVCEIKYKNESADFWDALKVLGYKTYFEWQSGQRARTAIIMPNEKIRLEHKIVAGRLGIQLIGAILNEDGSYNCVFIEG